MVITLTKYYDCTVKTNLKVEIKDIIKMKFRAPAASFL